MSKTLINFVHANGFPVSSYQTLFNYFPEQYQVVGHEKYGHDEKYPVQNNWQCLVDELIHYVTQQLELHQQEQIIGVGHSFGGVISFLAACQQPQLFKGIIMLDPPVISGTTAIAARYLKKTRLVDKFSPAGKAKTRRTHWPLGSNIERMFASRPLFKNFDPRCLRDYVSHGIVARNDQLELAFSAQVEANIFRYMPDHLSSYKNKLQVPATLVYSKHAPVFPVSFFKKFIKLNPNINLESASGGHLFPLEYPEDTAKLITNLIQSF
ncbi:MAG: alpha/beta hydrolase [Litorilituus sp.]|jgi:pimeloyl-ACP methyl ester carboxylesterase|nr:alpha/beta hydrolase [Litorilituus sp.]